jgi:membrane-associated phospholipid phosphatase
MNKRRQRILLLVLVIISLGFAAITVLVVLYPTSFIDTEFSKEVQEHQNKFLDAVMEVISMPGYMPESPIMVVFTSLVFFLFKYRKAALYILFTMLAGLVSTIVKALVNRPRPSDDVVRIVLKTTQQSFPSGHVLFYVVFFGFLVVLMYQLEDIPKFLRWFITALSLLMIFTVPFSRIYLGAHWFTDVTGGFLLGSLCLFLLSWLYLRVPAIKDEAPVPETK